MGLGLALLLVGNACGGRQTPPAAALEVSSAFRPDMRIVFPGGAPLDSIHDAQTKLTTAPSARGNRGVSVQSLLRSGPRLLDVKFTKVSSEESQRLVKMAMDYGAVRVDPCPCGPLPDNPADPAVTQIGEFLFERDRTCASERATLTQYGCVTSLSKITPATSSGALQEHAFIMESGATVDTKPKQVRRLVSRFTTSASATIDDWSPVSEIIIDSAHPDTRIQLDNGYRFGQPLYVATAPLPPSKIEPYVNKNIYRLSATPLGGPSSELKLMGAVLLFVHSGDVLTTSYTVSSQ